MATEEEDLPPTTSTDLLDPLPNSIPLTPSELLALPSSELTPSIIESTFKSLSDHEALTLASQLISSGKNDDSSLLRFMVQLGQERGSSEYTRLQQELGEDIVNEDNIRKSFEQENGRREIVERWTSLEEINTRLDTWDIIAPKPQIQEKQDQNVENNDDEKDEMELDDPWGETDEKEAIPPQTPSALLDDPWEIEQTSNTPEMPKTSKLIVVESFNSHEPTLEPISITLPSFLTQPIPLSALEIASTASLSALKTVCQRHYDQVYPFRFAIIEAIPGWVSPTELETQGFLPSLGEDEQEKWLSSSSTTNPTLFSTLSKLYLPISLTLVSPSIPSRLKPLSSSELTQWYINRIISLDSLGILDNQLAYVQHGASLGVNGLDEIGEDLSLLSRLAYDSNLSASQHSQWTLTNWRKSMPNQIIQGYLSNSSPESIVGDIRKLILPYLYVLESRLERTGKPDSGLVETLLYDCILDLPSLELALPIFEYSKATLPSPERIIKNDLDTARIALSLLYSTEEKSRGVWEVMSAIFECLPVWELEGTDPLEDQELTITTLESIAMFLTPTTVTQSSGELPSSKDLYLFFHPLPFSSLSRTLDILDVHLESGEILSKWGVYTGLKFLLQSSKNHKDQLELAEKLVRKQQYGNLNEDSWRKLWDDMTRLAGGDDDEGSPGGSLKGALGMLKRRERARVYLGGVLSSGNFDVARKVIKRLQQSSSIDDQMIEQVVLETSKEFYLKAENGNLHTGEMKLAYDCLSVSPQTNKILSEKSFIEATSRLSTFPSLTLTPLEIRHTTDPLTLIQQVLDSSNDSYKYPELIIDLSTKLGSTDEVDQGLIRVMIGKAAYGNDDYSKTKECIEDAMAAFRIMNKNKKGYERNKSSISSTDPTTRLGSNDLSTDPTTRLVPRSGETIETPRDNRLKLKDHLWKLSYLLSTTTDYSDTPSKIQLISYALELCPSSSIPEILGSYRVLEDGRIKFDKAMKRWRQTGISTENTHHRHAKGHDDSGINVRGEGVEERVLGSRTAAKAAKLALDIGGKFRSYSPNLGNQSPVLGQLPFHLSRSTSRSRSPVPPQGRISTPRMVSGPGIEDEVRSETGSDTASVRSHGTGHGPRELFENLGGGIDEAERVRQGARRVLVRGVGWLLGAEEGEITG
ncbi:hypothetical protein L486_04326 [Kwoniella mangroviensis CBS 10435]|uniref:Sec39 domain-containing protein n=1 Tax=Kwoniella mangroviensis CBS 10435 TaxID=1331196 RepID=A0A1B9IRX5_9TREE|nr:hypothetical protein L486_04326 [Kwoniella mangroviensis CBS 10435]